MIRSLSLLTKQELYSAFQIERLHAASRGIVPYIHPVSMSHSKVTIQILDFFPSKKRHKAK